MKIFVVIFAIFTAYSSVHGEQYEASIYGMQGLKLFTDNQDKLDFVLRHGDLPGFDFLRLPRSTQVPVEVLVAPENLEWFKHGLETNSIHYEVAVNDVSKVIEEELELQRRARLTQLRSEEDFTLKAFPTYDEISSYLRRLSETRRDVVSLFNISKSFERRDILGVKISSGPANDGQSKPALFIDAGIHAREWIAPTTALYAIKQLTQDNKYSYVYRDIDIYIIPSLNVDGYAYTHKSAGTRMWRKTRSINPSSNCIGVDANRNFDYKWMTIGASSYPCSETYAGSKAFSEPETVALRDFLLAHENIKVYLTLHSYGQYMLHPWGYTSELPENVETLTCVAVAAEKALSSVRGTHYEIGSSTNVLYAAAGGSDDWAMAVAGANLSYTIELPGGFYGFAPPPSAIIPVGEETFEAILIFAKYVEGEICPAA